MSDADAAPGEAAPQRAEQAKATVVSAPAKNGARGRITDGAVGKGGPIPTGALIAYTDGACTGNPGPMGVGVVIVDPISRERRERSEYLGEGTNNIAELVAIQRALELTPADRPIVVHSDSSYALGLLALGWKAKANQALVAELRSLVAARPELRLVKVAGHAGVPENERADELATSAVKRRSTIDTHAPGSR
jgi:ribonuclease HI